MLLRGEWSAPNSGPHQWWLHGPRPPSKTASNNVDKKMFPFNPYSGLSLSYFEILYKRNAGSKIKFIIICILRPKEVYLADVCNGRALREPGMKRASSNN